MSEPNPTPIRAALRLARLLRDAWHDKDGLTQKLGLSRRALERHLAAVAAEEDGFEVREVDERGRREYRIRPAAAAAAERRRGSPYEVLALAIAERFFRAFDPGGVADLLDQVLFEITGEDLEDGDAGGGGGGGFAAGNDAEQSSPVDRSRRALSRRFVLARPPQAVPGEVRQAFDRVLRGLVERRALDLRYHPRSGPPRDYVLRPYTLVLGEHELAVTGAVGAVPADGRPLSGDAIRTFALHRIREIKVRAERFTLPNLSAWDPEARYEGSWGLMVGEPEDVWVAIHPAFADLVAARSWHPSQIRAAAAADDWIRLQFRVFTGGEFRSWLLGWGPWLRVEEPAALRDWVDRMRTMRTAEGEPGPEEVFRIP